jgi:hypothetical protein
LRPEALVNLFGKPILYQSLRARSFDFQKSFVADEPIGAASHRVIIIGDEADPLSGLRGWSGTFKATDYAKGSMMLKPAFLRICAVARDDSQVVDESGGGDMAAFDGHSSPGGAETCEQLRPPQTVSASHGKQRSLWTPASNHRSRLARCASPAAQEENAEAHLSEDDWIDDDFTLVLSQPVNHLRIGPSWLAR